MNDHKLAERVDGKSAAADGAAGEPRTMQFVIEQRCPHRRTDAAYRLPMEFPRVIWVEIPASASMDCGGVSWIVTLEERLRVKQEFPSPPGRAPGYAVCEHMGHLIE